MKKEKTIRKEKLRFQAQRHTLPVTSLILLQDHHEKISMLFFLGHLGRLITISTINDFQGSLGLKGPTFGSQSNPRALRTQAC